MLYHLERKLKLIAGIFSQLLKSLTEKKNSPANVTKNISFSRIHCPVGLFRVFFGWVFDLGFFLVGGRGCFFGIFSFALDWLVVFA